ncbi:hypothetical protein D3C73_1278860 [compost metagenome]|uniref:Uncharacterized protein n=1 Tax=Paenibacillus jilunlii TaxID=682956 RepID=A0A1G9SX35_9BACL|nr:hypothetical protein [Paenibacillus jilunlii]KWX75073.1 hypothetical protein AML91_13480 [Paenibacillus jilunlii]SDM39963.1 hypothetical protein SAMN05216191_112104 [Paenibacillus jilunlii]
MREKEWGEKQEELLREYYSGQLPAPAGLCAATLRRVRRTEGMSKGAVVLGVLGVLTLLLLWGCLLSGPIPLLWKLTLLLSFGAAPIAAAVVIVLYMSSREAGSVPN